MKNILTRVSVPLNSSTIMDPVFGSRPLLEKFRGVRISTSLSTSEIILSHTYSLPVHLPDSGSTISLDITSENLASEFSELRRRETGNDVIILGRLYNFNPEANRAVSWGNFRVYKPDESMMRIHIANLMNDLMFKPSFKFGRGIWSPLRWFTVESGGEYRYAAIYTYNTFIVYLNPAEMEKCKRMHIWLGKPLEVFSIPAGFIRLTDTGRVIIEKINLCFFEDPATMLPRDARGYYICFSESFNYYTTNYPAFPFRRIDLNLVHFMFPLIHSPYDILPFVSPYFLDPTDDLVIRFSVPENLLKAVIRRFEKFGGPQKKFMVDNFEQLIEKFNNLLRISSSENNLIVTLANPPVVAHLVKTGILRYGFYGRHAEKILRSCGTELLERLACGEKDLSKDFELGVSLAGCGTATRLSIENMRGYLDIFRKAAPGQYRKL